MPQSTTKHILFMDIVGFSRLNDATQVAMVGALERLITAALESEHASVESRIVLPTGDGYALAFDELKAPVAVAVAVARAIRQMPPGKHIPLRTGIHPGPVYSIETLNAAWNVIGSGANIAARVMDLGDDGHILVSEASHGQAGQHHPDWHKEWTGAPDAQLTDLGGLTVKHGQQVSVHSLHGDGFGKAELPAKAAAELAETRRAEREAVRRIHVRDAGKGKVEITLEGEEDAGHAYTADMPEQLAPAERRELAWYLEEYLSFPYGAERDRAARVEVRMEEWGGRLRDALFGDGRGAEILAEAVAGGLAGRELCIHSDDARFLARPWELVHDDDEDYLAFGFRGLYRTRATPADPVGDLPEHGEPFRILLVVCRPYGERDVGHGAVSRPMLEALRELRPRIELDVLRPPTFAALTARLQQRPYHLVHFDGHGAFPQRPGMTMGMTLGAKEGLLVFEDKDGEPDPIDAARLRRGLRQSHVPLWVLNACQSAMVGEDDAIASVASRLTQAGAHAVVAMSHSVYKDAASIFVGAFYAALARHATMSEAVAAGRRAMHANRTRQSVAGKLELSDWVVPALYQQTAAVTPIPETVGTTPVDLGDSDVVRDRVERVCPTGDYSFIGRDSDVQRIERAMYQTDRHVVTLSGVGGTGKTELANGFARWYSETGGCSGGVFRAEFGDGTDFARVMASVFGYGTDHSRLSDEHQWAHLVGYLTQNACLLVWDNFETVAGYGSDGIAPDVADDGEQAQLVQPASAAERGQFMRLVDELRGGPTRVVITTRKSEERWLGAAAQKVEIGGLVAHDRVRLARSILDSVGKTPDNFAEDQDFARLLTMLDGHPRSMEVVLPLLERRTPSDVIASLEHETREGSGLEDASLEVAFRALSEESRTHLPFLGLFVSRVHTSVLASFVHSDDSQQVAYEKLVGPSPDAEGWAHVLDEAARHGLVRHAGGVQYSLHATLPVFLRRRLRDEIGAAGVETLNTQYMRFYAEFAGRRRVMAEQGRRAAIADLRAEEPNILRALSVALGGDPEWTPAAVMIETLFELYEHEANMHMSASLVARGLSVVGIDAPPAAECKRRDLWLDLMSRSASIAVTLGHLEVAELKYTRVLDEMDLSSGSTDATHVAATRFQLSVIAARQHAYDRAAELAADARVVYERLGDAPRLAQVEYQEAMVAYMQREWDQADVLFGRAMGMLQSVGDERTCAMVDHMRSVIALERGDRAAAHRLAVAAREAFERLELPALRGGRVAPTRRHRRSVLRLQHR
ncbi:CHAT domain-containing protein [Candidatus Poribacteria bacterium]|jgi:class 3 adenylate cyclase|nr:CHAT domain-containing protein [Candidatus Poribacteria bacterium]MBT5531628.1 CHAT domain-containing protein [Candidatus Poribacteria bacterium]MBT7096113.1 CHAT domain-containing protein [Candidatus Poribacteria bacterium]MBT7808823.1 CHAT domain-containing protein [Candidatus Poribacteria bacterium]